MQVIRIDAESVAVYPGGRRGIVQYDPVRGIQFRIGGAEGVVVRTGIAPGQQPVAAVLPEVLALRQHDDLPRIAVDEADYLLTGMTLVVVDHRPEEVPRRGEEEKARSPEVLVDRGFEDVPFRGLDLDGYEVPVHDLLVELPLVHPLPAEGEHHDDVVLEPVPPVIGKHVVRLLDSVVPAHIHDVTFLPTGGEEDSCEVGSEWTVREILEDCFLSVHGFSRLSFVSLRLKGKVPALR